MFKASVVGRGVLRCGINNRPSLPLLAEVVVFCLRAGRAGPKNSQHSQQSRQRRGSLVVLRFAVAAHCTQRWLLACANGRAFAV